MSVIAFTGHRPSKLVKTDDITRALRELVKTYPANHYICGGALGTDMIAFEICYRYQRGCKIEIAVPIEEQSKNYREIDKELYKTQLLRASKVTHVYELPEYRGRNVYEKMQRRNEYMVDQADLIIAVWDGSKSGTKNCIDYALSKYKKVICLNPNTLEVTVLENNQISLF